MLGFSKANRADPNTKKGNNDVKYANVASRRLVLLIRLDDDGEEADDGGTATVVSSGLLLSSFLLLVDDSCRMEDLDNHTFVIVLLGDFGINFVVDIRHEATPQGANARAPTHGATMKSDSSISQMNRLVRKVNTIIFGVIECCCSDPPPLYSC